MSISRISFSDDDLKQAAGMVRESMLSSLPEPENCHHDYSEAFQYKMNRLISKRKTNHVVLRRVAAIFVAVMIGLSAWLTTDASARSALFQWVREFYEEHIIYRFFGAPQTYGLPQYHITAVPEGYVETSYVMGDTMCVITYENAGTPLYFQYSTMTANSHVEILPSEAKAEDINIDGMAGHFYLSEDPAETNELVWFDENNGISFGLSGFLEKSVMLNIADSVKLEEINKNK